MTVPSNFKTWREIFFSNFVAFSQYLNFMYDNVIVNGQHKYLPNTINGHEFVVAAPYQRPDSGPDVHPGKGLPIVLRGPSTPLGVLPHVDVSGIGCGRQYFFSGTKFQTRNEHKCRNILAKGKKYIG